MARIRTIKPDFFRHEALFDAERESGLPLRLSFAGLWTACDREGRFAWKPRALKLDCLPFDDTDFAAVLDALVKYGFVVKYEVGADTYGHIPSWGKHQHVNQREAASTIPSPDEDGARTCTHVSARGEGKGREQEGKGKGMEERASAPPSPNQPPASKPNVAKREHWPEGGIVPEPWLRGAEAERRRLGLPPVDMAVVGVKFANFHIAKANQPRTQTEWQAAFNNFALDEKIGKSNGSPASGQHGQPSRVTRIVGEFIAESRARSEAGSG